MIRENFSNDSMADGRLETCSMSGRLKLVIGREGLESKLDARIEQTKCQCGCQLVTLAVQQQSLCDVSETFQ